MYREHGLNNKAGKREEGGKEKWLAVSPLKLCDVAFTMWHGQASAV